MAKDNISAKFLIHLIGERPALWDNTSEDYRDRSIRETSWREICSFINENFERMTPISKEGYTRMIMKKWTHIRDSWVKSMKYGVDEVTKKPLKPYIYHNELQFLQKIFRSKPKRFSFGISYLSNEELYGFNIETQNSIIEPNCSENNDAVEGEVTETAGHRDEQVEIVKEETKTDSSQIKENHRSNTTDDDDWPLNEVDLATVNNENEDKRPKVSPPVKQARTSTFVTSHRNSENQEQRRQTTTAAASQYQTTSAPTLPRTNNRSCTAFNGNNYFTDNRHLSFFKAILPSVIGLDEDHTLQFQSGVITLLQKLRESQNRQKMATSGRSRRRKRKKSDDNDNEWSEHTIDVSKGYLRRSTINVSDPIAAEETAYSTD